MINTGLLLTGNSFWIGLAYQAHIFIKKQED